VLVVFALFSLTATGWSLTLRELYEDATLSPETLTQRFAHFKFEFRGAVQRPEIFLSRKTGDCDDFATLAAELLKARGFTPRLIAVRMNKLVHVVCYVDEAGGYLDYNQRNNPAGMVRCARALHQIADKVADSFEASWSSVSEFSFADRAKRVVQTVLPSDRPRSASVPQSIDRSQGSS
jgi:hypothetical protein